MSVFTPGSTSNVYEAPEAPLAAFPFSWSGWFLLQASASTAVFGMGGSTGFDWCYIGTNNTGSVGRYALRSAASGSQTAETANSFNIGKWNHIVGCSHAANDHICILNGNWAQRGTNTNTVTLNFPFGETRIGSTADSTPSSAFDGHVDYCAAWNVGLTRGEVSQLASGVDPIEIRPGSHVTCPDMSSAKPFLKDRAKDGLLYDEIGTVVTGGRPFVVEKPQRIFFVPSAPPVGFAYSFGSIAG